MSPPTNERKCNEPEDQDGKVMVIFQYRGQITDSFVKKLKVSAPIQSVLTLRKLKTVLSSLKPTTKAEMRSRVVYNFLKVNTG